MKQKDIVIGKTYFVKDNSCIPPGFSKNEKFVVDFIEQRRNGKIRYFGQEGKWIYAERLTDIPC